MPHHSVSDYRGVELLGCRTIGVSDYRGVGLSNRPHRKMRIAKCDRFCVTISIHRLKSRDLFYIFDLTLQCLQYKVSMLKNSGDILFKTMAAQNIDLNIISGLSTINKADFNSMLNGYLTHGQIRAGV